MKTLHFNQIRYFEQWQDNVVELWVNIFFFSFFLCILHDITQSDLNSIFLYL